METKDELRTLGKTCDILSAIITVMLCLIMPVAFFIYRKNANRHFSIYERWQQYTAGTISESFLKKAIIKTKITILAFGLPILGVIVALLLSEDNLFKSSLEDLLLLLIVVPFPIFYYLCVKVTNNLIVHV